MKNTQPPEKINMQVPSEIFTHTVDHLNQIDQDTTKRFAKAFEQTHARFLDLQKAAIQAREAQIEAALERVRTQTMAMHSSADVGRCIVKMFRAPIVFGADALDIQETHSMAHVKSVKSTNP